MVLKIDKEISVEEIYPNLEFGGVEIRIVKSINKRISGSDTTLLTYFIVLHKNIILYLDAKVVNYVNVKILHGKLSDIGLCAI